MSKPLMTGNHGCSLSLSTCIQLEDSFCTQPIDPFLLQPFGTWLSQMPHHLQTGKIERQSLFLRQPRNALHHGGHHVEHAALVGLNRFKSGSCIKAWQ